MLSNFHGNITGMKLNFKVNADIGVDEMFQYIISIRGSAHEPRPNENITNQRFVAQHLIRALFDTTIDNKILFNWLNL
jgi:hypothetical protein